MQLPPLEQIVFLDIETVPEIEHFSELDPEMQELFANKTAYQRREDISPKEFYQRAGIWAEFGKIICKSVGYFAIFGSERQFRTTSFFGEEKKMLQDFANLLTTRFAKRDLYLCGHNLKEFDLPFICRRMIINDMKIPTILNLLGKKPWEVKHLDTMELWKFGDYKHFTSLKLLCKVLGIPTPKDDIDGSKVAEVYYQDQNIDRIIIYCEKDVVAVAQIVLKMTQNRLLEPFEIKSV